MEKKYNNNGSLREAPEEGSEYWYIEYERVLGFEYLNLHKSTFDKEDDQGRKSIAHMFRLLTQNCFDSKEATKSYLIGLVEGVQALNGSNSPSIEVKSKEA